VLDINDIFHLPPVDDLIGQLVADGPGLIIVAGFDPPVTLAQDTFLPSGKAGLLRILMRQILFARPHSRAVVVTRDRESVHIPRNLTRMVVVATPRENEDIAQCIARAALHRPELLVIDMLTPEVTTAALSAASQGLRVLAPMDTALRGADLAQHLLLWGAQPEQLSALSWVISVQRMATLCPTCRKADRLDESRISTYRTRLSGFDPQVAYSVAQGGEECHGTGRKGDVSVFDFFHATAPAPALFNIPSQLTAGQYALALAAQGYLALDDVLHVETGQLIRLQQLLEASQQAFAENNHALRLKLLELETSNRVLQQRTEALISLERLGSELIGSGNLEDIGKSVCRYARQLCGAERAILYVLQPDDTAHVLAVNGWSDDLLGLQLAAREVFGATQGVDPTPYREWPPGVPRRDPDLEGARLYQGLRVPLVAQEKLVGLLIVHPTTKPRFNQGEVALLRTLANQAALAIQRGELVDSLRAKIVELETAQVELVQKERLERELELARTVQQSLLPRSFPQYAGYTFAARCVPAREVGGDFYDVFALAPHRFGIVIADVSDKGMPSALFMALTRSLLLAEAERENSPRAVLENVNRLLLALAQSEMFVTVFYGVVDARECTLTYARAGHDKPILVRAGAANLLGGGGLVLGQLESAVLGLTEERINLKTGDRLALFTDGLTDVQDAQEAMYGHPRLTQLLQSVAQSPADELCAAVFNELTSFQGQAEQYDDMTLLVVQVG
jgi:serine phosphatase RsbU (regulator of sigma subunit)